MDISKVILVATQAENILFTTAPIAIDLAQKIVALIKGDPDEDFDVQIVGLKNRIVTAVNAETALNDQWRADNPDSSTGSMTSTVKPASIVPSALPLVPKS